MSIFIFTYFHISIFSYCHIFIFPYFHISMFSKFPILSYVMFQSVHVSIFSYFHIFIFPCVRNSWPAGTSKRQLEPPWSCSSIHWSCGDKGFSPGHCDHAGHSAMGSKNIKFRSLRAPFVIVGLAIRPQPLQTPSPLRLTVHSLRRGRSRSRAPVDVHRHELGTGELYEHWHSAKLAYTTHSANTAPSCHRSSPNCTLWFTIARLGGSM
jgi:hypothetical protein